MNKGKGDDRYFRWREVICGLDFVNEWYRESKWDLRGEGFGVV